MTTISQTIPNWVRWALARSEGRRAAMWSFRAIVVLAVCFSLQRISLFGLSSYMAGGYALLAIWVRLAIRWMDQHEGWNDADIGPMIKYAKAQQRNAHDLGER